MHEGWNRVITEAEAVRIAAEIEQQGYGTLSNYVSEEELNPIRAVANDAVKASGGEYAGFEGADAFAGTMLGELPRSAAFKGLCRRLYELGTGKPAQEVDTLQVFRCLKGTTGRRTSYKFHYDSYVLTVLLPVAIPQEGRSGDLLIIPNARRVRRLYLSNLMDKLIIDNKVAQVILRLITRRRRLNTVAVKLQPGTSYFFWGYRSIHANEPCDHDKLRATALFHYGDPHRNSSARTLIRRARAFCTSDPAKLAALGFPRTPRQGPGPAS